MRPARVGPAAATAVVVALLGWLALRWWSGRTGGFLPMPWTAVAGTAALAAVVVAAGLPVRRWVSGRRDRPLDPLTAARTVVLAKAAAYGGAALAGWYLAQALVLVPDLVGARRVRFWLALAAAGAAVALSIAGFVVQRWCRIPPDEDDAPPGSG